MELTQYGNILHRGFSMAGSDGSEMDIFSMLSKKGFREFQYSAPYSWTLVNIEEMKIFTYCEGDTCMTECKTKETFQQELMSHWNFWNVGNARDLDGDSVETMKAAGLEVEDPKWIKEQEEKWNSQKA